MGEFEIGDKLLRVIRDSETHMILRVMDELTQELIRRFGVQQVTEMMVGAAAIIELDDADIIIMELSDQEDTDRTN